MAFGVVSTDESASDFLGSLADIERIFADTTDAREIACYYEEAFLGAEPNAETLSRTQLRHVVLMRGPVMEQAYFALTLSRSANAPSNRGWINLFRRWAGSRTFNEWFDRYRELFSRQFIAFYDNYLRFYNRTIDVAPLPHPWDAQMPLAPHAPPPADESSGNVKRSGGRPACRFRATLEDSRRLPRLGDRGDNADRCARRRIVRRRRRHADAGTDALERVQGDDDGLRHTGRGGSDPQRVIEGAVACAGSPPRRRRAREPSRSAESVARR